ncbi:thiamine-phosphate kinase [Archaeoglobales archaeon]|nr:MAG: thiamine-phosphate kinase [Archaeoglobales archaeon]
MREFKLIEKASKIFAVERDDILIAAGEHDAAIVKIGGKNVVLTTDNLHEKADFPEGMFPEEMGHMALAVNLSDLAACGAKPMHFLYTITIRDGIDDEFFERILDGMQKLAKKYDVAVVGGDIDFGDELYISGFALGVAQRIVTQANAKVGDGVYLTGLLGKAQLSLEQLFSGKKREEIAYPQSLFTPEPRINEGLELAKHANSMTDISDSLAISLNLIAEKSNVSIVLDYDLLPLDHLTEFVSLHKALELFLYAGGDYELVYTSKKKSYGFEIGEVVEGEGVWMKKGDKIDKIEFRGYSHL